MKISRTIGSRSPHITSLNSGTEMRIIGICQNSDDCVPTRNIRSFYLFEGGISYFSNRSRSWHGAAQNESENPEGDSIFKNTRRENNFEVEKVGRKSSVILNHVYSKSHQGRLKSRRFESYQHGLKLRSFKSRRFESTHYQ